MISSSVSLTIFTRLSPRSIGIRMVDRIDCLSYMHLDVPLPAPHDTSSVLRHRHWTERIVLDYVPEPVILDSLI